MAYFLYNLNHNIMEGIYNKLFLYFHLDIDLKALPRSATAQKITSYVSMITGPTPVAYPDGTIGDKELHIVLLDNGRTQMQSDPVFKETLQCIRCARYLPRFMPYERLFGANPGTARTIGPGRIQPGGAGMLRPVLWFWWFIFN